MIDIAVSKTENSEVIHYSKIKLAHGIKQDWRRSPAYVSGA